MNLKRAGVCIINITGLAFDGARLLPLRLLARMLHGVAERHALLLVLLTGIRWLG